MKELIHYFKNNGTENKTNRVAKTIKKLSCKLNIFRKDI